VAALRKQKTLDRWVKAAALISDLDRPVRFLLVGDGPERARVERHVAELGLNPQFIFAGLVQDVWPFLSAMDVFMQSSDFEGLPLAVLEAMAAGLPVVATDVGGVKEAVVHEQTGFVIETTDAGVLARRVKWLLDDGNLRIRMGSASREVVAARFSAVAMTNAIETVYRRVLDA
jgi:glycosyltransferase involved in cell wall biosynthesis